jgi:hypothetical protein
VGATVHDKPWPLFYNSLIYTVSRTPWAGISSPQDRYLHRITQTQDKRRQIFMPRMGFEPSSPMLERAKTVHASDREANVIGKGFILSRINSESEQDRGPNP